ncbi:hypothetical protein PMAYCL1PPCAC_12764, partial [Pristionchus mayeri]
NPSGIRHRALLHLSEGAADSALLVSIDDPSHRHLLLLHSSLISSSQAMAAMRAIVGHRPVYVHVRTGFNVDGMRSSEMDDWRKEAMEELEKSSLVIQCRLPETT